jgi:uncharacterized SAM-binding protein YcdF (DUF218 family)
VSDAPAIVIFGAAVRADGRPSPALARRIAYGLKAAGDAEDAPILCSGAVGRAGPSEASVMAAALKGQGVAPGRLVLDEESRDTLQSVVVTARFLAARGLSHCIVCSDRYHIPRIRLLLGVLGVRTVTGPLAPGRGGTRLAYWLTMSLREVLYTVYHMAIVLVRGRRLLEASGR